LKIAVRAISPKLREFSSKYVDAAAPLKAWFKLIKNGRYGNLADLKKTFGSVDLVPVKRKNKTVDYFVFNLGGNQYRLVATIHFNTQLLFVRDVLTHQNYGTGGWEK
jgi:mRNA interferase HigB